MKNAIQGAQMLFVAFGALVLVPLLTGLDPNVALFGAGLGTLLFQLITRRSVPISSPLLLLLSLLLCSASKPGAFLPLWVA